LCWVAAPKAQWFTAKLKCLGSRVQIRLVTLWFDSNASVSLLGGIFTTSFHLFLYGSGQPLVFEQKNSRPVIVTTCFHLFLYGSGQPLVFELKGIAPDLSLLPLASIFFLYGSGQFLVFKLKGIVPDLS